MYLITDHHIDYILGDLDAKGIKIPALQQSLLDHICILVERNLEEGEDFEAYYRSVLPSFYREELAEIEQETKFMLRHRGPMFMLTRTQFLLCLFLLMVGPFVGCFILWMVRVGPGHGYDMPLQMLGSLVAFSLFPLLIWVVLALTPDRFDPLLPKGAKVLLGRRPFISVL